MTSKIQTVAINGLSAEIVDVEADILRGLPSFTIVGLGDTSVQEAKERVRSAVKNSNLTFPIERKTINLAPAQFKKSGPSFDLPIAISLLTASGQLSADRLHKSIVVGELALNGEIKRVKGILSVANHAKENGFINLFVPYENLMEASLCSGIQVFGVKTLKEFVSHLRGEKQIKGILIEKIPKSYYSTNPKPHTSQTTFSQIYGLENAKRALTIAAAGSHNVLLHGTPGAGKTVLARAFASLLTDMTEQEALEVTKIYSIIQGLPPENPLITTRPFREVHHTASKVAIVGGGANAKPGEITLAHNGVLFLDELTEFPRDVLNVLRQPLEDGHIRITRSKSTQIYPCDFILLAAINPCPCGYAQGQKKRCKCTENQKQKYLSRISGPILDRIDLFVSAPQITIANFLDEKAKDNQDHEIKSQITLATETQKSRYKTLGISKNKDLSAQQIASHLKISTPAKQILKKAASSLNLSNRGYLKTIKIAQTIADLSQSPEITETHILESLQYRIPQFLS